MKTSVIGRKLAVSLLNSCFSPKQIDECMPKISRQIGGVSWRHVGWSSDSPNINNAGLCDIASDKRSPIAEVVVNCIDSVIDLVHVATGLKAASPREAVTSWDADSLGAGDWKKGRISISLQDGDSKSRPTIDFRDLGRGQHPEDFRHTFLDLHSSTKLSLPHLCGKFGMGLKSSFKFCDRVVIVSRPHRSSIKGRQPEVGFAVVRNVFPDGDKAAHYEYLCDARGQVIRLDLSESDFESGTLVRLAGYDLAGYEGNIGRQNKSLRLMLNSYIIDPPVEIKASDCRGSGAGSKKNMTVYGLLHALQNPQTPNSHEESFGIRVNFKGRESEVLVRYFVLHPNESPHDQSGTKVKAEQAITFSHNGQRHGVESRSFLKSRFGLGSICSRLAVVIDTSGLHPTACSELYSSDRVKTNSQSEVYVAIMESLKAQFDADEVLQELDDEATKQGRVNNSAQTETLEKAMTQFVGDLIGKKQIMRKVGVGVAKGGGKKKPRNRDDSHLPTLPTRVLVDNSPLVAPKGRFAYLTLDIDAKNGYVEPGDKKVSVSFHNGLAHVKTVGRLVGGKLRLIVDVPDASPKGESSFDVKLDDPANGIHLSASGRLKIVEPRSGKSGGGNKKTGGKGEELSPPPAFVVWVDESNWEEGWDENFPGECVPQSSGGVVNSVTFRLNLDFGPIRSVRNRLAKNKSKVFDRRRDGQYGETICKALAYQKFNGLSADASFAKALAESVFHGISYEAEDVEDDSDSPKFKGRKPTPSATRGILSHATFLAESRAASEAS